MSYLGIALQRQIEQRRMSQSDLARHSGISRSYISRLLSGEFHELSDSNFVALLKVFGSDPQAQAGIVVARCQDTLAAARNAQVPGVSLVDITVKKTIPQSATCKPQSPEFDHVELNHEAERAFAWLRSQCPVNHELQKHLVGYAKLTGMP